MKRTISTVTVLLALGGAVTFTQSGCAFIAWFVAQFAPPKKVPAVYTPPPGKKILVFVSDEENPVEYIRIKADLAERINKHLLDRKIAGSTIRHEMVADLELTDPDFPRLAISEVGEKLGADAVLYVRIDDFALKDNPASVLWSGRLETTVWMVECPSGDRMWPKDRPEGSGHPVAAVRTTPNDEPSPYYARNVAEELAVKMADEVAKLFYDHTEPRTAR